MKQFTDSLGRAWKIELNVGSLTRVRDLTQVNLWDTLAGGAEKVLELVGDPFALASVLHALVRPQIEERKQTDQEFFAGLDGTALFAAGQAFLQEAYDFFQKSRGTSGMTAMIDELLAKESRLKAALTKRAQAELDRIDPEAEAERLFAQLAKDSKSSPGSLPASSV